MGILRSEGCHGELTTVCLKELTAVSHWRPDTASLRLTHNLFYSSFFLSHSFPICALYSTLHSTLLYSLQSTLIHGSHNSLKRELQ